MLDNGRETFGTSPLDGVPNEVLRMPSDSLWPFLLTVALSVVFVGLLTRIWWLSGVGGGLLAITIVGWLWPSSHAPVQEV